MTEVRSTPSKSPEERLEEVKSLVFELGTVRIDQLAADFGVSEMTIRRDLDELEVLGLAHRIRGGAVAVGPEPWDRRRMHNADAKMTIAHKLLDVVPRVGAVAFDASTTIFRLASVVERVDDLTVVTNGWDTFHAIHRRPGVSASVTGGSQERRTGSLVGPVAVRAAESFLYDAFLCSAAGLDVGLGASEAALAETEVKRAFARTSQRVILGLDHAKLGSRAQARVFDFDDIDLLVTDLDPKDRLLDPYRDLVEIL